MLWKLRIVDSGPAGATEQDPAPEGRFVLHRHRDSAGPHLDLRLECGSMLLGWRIEGAAWGEEMCASEKGPHPLHWLDQDGEAVRVFSGSYAWAQRNQEEGDLLLFSEEARISLRVERESLPALQDLRALRSALEEKKIPFSEAVTLVEDGLVARQRALLRLCGLGREVEGSGFDEAGWRRLLAGQPLTEIHRHLETMEVRFDAKYPPSPVSKPENLPETQADTRRQAALAIAQD